MKLLIAVQIAQALVYLHSEEPPALHRDIKPSNILFWIVGDVVLIKVWSRTE